MKDGDEGRKDEGWGCVRNPVTDEAAGRDGEHEPDKSRMILPCPLLVPP